jgi:hypothetical protein
MRQFFKSLAWRSQLFYENELQCKLSSFERRQFLRAFYEYRFPDELIYQIVEDLEKQEGGPFCQRFGRALNASVKSQAFGCSGLFRSGRYGLI